MWLPLAGAAVLTVGFLLGLGLQQSRGPLVRLVDDETVAPNALGVGRVEGILRYVEAKYVDEVDADSLVDAAVQALVSGLDPYSRYVGPDDLHRHHARLSGTVEGTGVELGMLRDSMLVLDVLPNSPAQEAGLAVADRVVAIDGEAVSGVGYTLERLAERFGAMDPGAVVRVAVVRPGEGRLPEVALQRRTLVVPTVGEGRVLAGDVGYIPVTQFADSTYFEFMTELERLVEREGARHLILDLRGNGGGYLREAVRILGQFFPEAGTLLVYTEGAHAPRREYTSTGRVLFPVDRVVVLVDENSASASEIVAGTLQDWDRGTVVGRPTFGKGLVQELFELKGAGALHLTVSRYFLPSGRSIQRPYGGRVDTRPAFASAGGRELLGGGGIDPDVVVAVDSAYDVHAGMRGGLRADADVRAALALLEGRR